MAGFDKFPGTGKLSLLLKIDTKSFFYYYFTFNIKV